MQILNFKVPGAVSAITACVILHNYTLRVGEKVEDIMSSDVSADSLRAALPHDQGDCHTDRSLAHGSAVNAHQSSLRESLSDILHANGMVRPTPAHFRVAAGPLDDGQL
jgi:hypothetical protein